MRTLCKSSLQPYTALSCCLMPHASPLALQLSAGPLQRLASRQNVLPRRCALLPPLASAAAARQWRRQLGHSARRRSTSLQNWAVACKCKSHTAYTHMKSGSSTGGEKGSSTAAAPLFAPRPPRSPPPAAAAAAAPPPAPAPGPKRPSGARGSSGLRPSVGGAETWRYGVNGCGLHGGDGGEVAGQDR